MRLGSYTNFELSHFTSKFVLIILKNTIIIMYVINFNNAFIYECMQSPSESYYGTCKLLVFNKIKLLVRWSENKWRIMRTHCSSKSILIILVWSHQF